MQYEMHKRDDGILCVSLIGDVDEESMMGLIEDYQPFIEAATEEQPLLVLWEISQAGKLSAKARKTLAGLGHDPRLGKSAIVGMGRYQRVMTGFISRATGWDDMGFFESEEKALDWLNATR